MVFGQDSTFEPSCRTCAYGQSGSRSIYFIVTLAYHSILVGLLVGRSDRRRFARVCAPAVLIVILLVPTLASFSSGSTKTRVGIRCFSLLLGSLKSLLAIGYVLTDPETSTPQLRLVKTGRPIELPELRSEFSFNLFLSQ